MGLVAQDARLATRILQAHAEVGTFSARAESAQLVAVLKGTIGRDKRVATDAGNAAALVVSLRMARKSALSCYMSILGETLNGRPENNFGDNEEGQPVPLV